MLHAFVTYDLHSLEELARRATLTFGIALRLNGHDLEAQGGFDAV